MTRQKWKVTFGFTEKQIVGSLSDALTAARELIANSGRNVELISTYNTSHGYQGFYYWEELDYVNSHGEMIEKGIARVQEVFWQ